MYPRVPRVRPSGSIRWLEAWVPSDGGTKLFGASEASFLTSSTAALTAAPPANGSITLVDVLRHAREDLVYLVGGRVGRYMHLKVDVYVGRLLLLEMAIVTSARLGILRRSRDHS